MTIKFLKDSNCYDNGDVVEVADELAEQLIKAGTAEQYQPDAPKAKAPDVGKPAKAGK